MVSFDEAGKDAGIAPTSYDAHLIRHGAVGHRTCDARDIFARETGINRTE